MLIYYSVRNIILVASMLVLAAEVTAGTKPSLTSAKVTALPERAQPRSPKRLALMKGASRIELPVTVKIADIGKEGPRDVSVILQRGGLVVLTDSYGSRPQGLHRCQAGSERYARVIDVPSRRERFARLVESCLEDALSGDPAYTVQGDGRSVVFNMLSGPPFTVTLNDNGTFTVKP